MKLFQLGTKVVGNKNVRLVEVSGFTTLLDWFESELTVKSNFHINNSNRH